MTKNISISDDAYNVLLRRKIRERESFSELITREFGNKEKLKKLIGIFEGRKGEEFEKNLEKIRRIRAIADKKRIERMKNAFN